jgi:hypothetical protein
LAAISLAAVPVTPMTFVKFNFKFDNPSKSYEIHKTRIRQFAFTLAKHVVIQDQQGEHTASVFLKESSRPVVVLLLSYICIYVRLVLTDSNTTASPILHLTPLDFNFWGHTKDLIYEVEINTKGQLQKPVIDAANQIRKNPEMLNSVYENWYRRTQMCLNAKGRHTEHLL